MVTPLELLGLAAFILAGAAIGGLIGHMIGHK